MLLYHPPFKNSVFPPLGSFILSFHLILSLTLSLFNTKRFPKVSHKYYLTFKWGAESKASITLFIHEINLARLNASIQATEVVSS